MIRSAYIASLKSYMAVLRNFVGRMSQEEIERRIDDFWTIYQHIEHLVESQRVLLGRMEQFIDEERPVIKPYTPDGAESPTRPSIAVLLNEFDRLRRLQLKTIRKAGAGAWEKTGEHPEFKRYDFDILVRHAILHDGFHMWRMEELWIKKEGLILPLNSN